MGGASSRSIWSLSVVRTYLLKRGGTWESKSWGEFTGENGLYSHSMFCEAPQSGSDYGPPHQHSEATWTPEVPKASFSVPISVTLHSLFFYQQAVETIADQTLEEKIHMTPMKT